MHHRLFTMREVAPYLRISHRSVRRLIRLGLLPYKRLAPRTIRIDAEVVERWLLHGTELLEAWQRGDLTTTEVRSLLSGGAPELAVEHLRRWLAGGTAARAARRRRSDAAGEYLAVTEVGRVLGVSRWTVVRSIQRGRLTAYRPALRKLLIPRDELDRFRREDHPRRRRRSSARI